MATSQKTEPKAEEVNVQEMINGLVENGKKALNAMYEFDQAKVDHIVHRMALAGLDKHMPLAKMAVEETGRGIYEDKCIKNMFATEYIWNNIKNDKTVGIIKEDHIREVTEIAEPIGVICGVTPVTNPTSTTMFKILISLKTRNPIIFAFHPGAQKCCIAAATVMRDAAIEAGAPANCIQWIEHGSLEATTALMNHPGIATVLATGGSGMVKSAYSTGKPALGVGPGNTPAYIEKTANIKVSVNDLVLSKTFDNGMICASEQSVIVDKEIYADAKAELTKQKCYFVKTSELKKLEDAVMNADKTAVNPKIVGQSADFIAKKAGLKVPTGTNILIAELDGVGADYPLSREKLSPVLAMYKAKSTKDGIALAESILQFGGLGHTAVIHSADTKVQMDFANRVTAYRILVNSPSSQGAIGDLYNELIPSLTLGCGSEGGNSISKNVTATHLMNIKTIGRRRKNMQWFRLPSKIFFHKNSVQYLKTWENVERVFLVCDPGMVKFGYADIVCDVLRSRNNKVTITVFSEVEPDPSDETVFKGTNLMYDFEPDTIIALGGGSAMDAAKGMRLFYEHQETEFFGLKQKFLDIRKRTYKFPKTGVKAQFCAIPTTSGTGAEVTPFAVITDKKQNVKYPLADYALTPNLAIIDPQFVLTLPKSLVADTGMDVLTHAFESYISVMSTDYTKGLSMRAIEMVFATLQKSYEVGDEESRETMHNASAMAGMAFANAFLGINHSLAHKIGPEFGIPHGRANTILMPHVIRYNAQAPTKRALFPKYDHFHAHEDYAHIARTLGFPAKTTEEGVQSLIDEVIKLGKKVNIDMSIKGQGVDLKHFNSVVDVLAERAFEDQCTTANPKQPLISELREILVEAYEGV